MGFIGRWLGSWFGNLQMSFHFHAPVTMNVLNANGKLRAHSPRVLEIPQAQEMRHREGPRLQIALAPPRRDLTLSRPSSAAVRESWARTFKDIGSKRV
jgi:hypothetical protein